MHNMHLQNMTTGTISKYCIVSKWHYLLTICMSFYYHASTKYVSYLYNDIIIILYMLDNQTKWFTEKYEFSCDHGKCAFQKYFCSFWLDLDGLEQ